MEMEIVGSILNEVCTGHSLDSTQMTILMDDLYNASLLVFTNSVYDRLSVETGNDGEAVL